MKVWNRCDCCGKFIPFKDFEDETAMREMVTPDTYFTSETYQTLCAKCLPILYPNEYRNAKEDTGTRQLCVECGEPIERCEDDDLYVVEIGPLCRECYNIVEHKMY